MMAIRLALTGRLSQHPLKILHIIMFIALNHSSRKSRPNTNRSMIQFIRDNQAAFPANAGNEVAFVLKPIENTIASGFPTNAAISRSTSTVKSDVPTSALELAELVPNS
jgi:hypothetical protein